MTNKHDTQSSAQPATAKRKFTTHKPLMIAAALALSAVALPASAATHWWNANPSIKIGATTINVKNKGARGNGSHNDTAAFQAAINALPSSGGTVVVPAGHYMINALKPIRLRSHTRLKMDPSATLEVIPNSAGRYYAIKVTNVNNVIIVGGHLVGDRAKHKGKTGEWGYGINISGSKHVLVKQTKVSKFWGDGFLIGGIGSGKRLVRSDYVTLNGVVSNNNRRQGLSITPAAHVYVVNSVFENTRGTLPEAGIDIEPQTQGPATTIRLEKNTFSGNHGNGVELHNNISNIALISNQLVNNHGFGVMAINSTQLNLTGNHATRNGLAGVRMSAKTNHATIKANKLQYNSTRYISPTKAGGDSQRDIQISAGAYAIKQSGNIFSPKKK